MTGREAKAEYNVKVWAERFRERAHSGQTVRAWCSEKGVSVRTYYYRLRQVRECAAQMMNATRGDSVTEIVSDAESNELLPVNTGSAELSVPNGWSVCVESEQKSPASKTLPIEIGKCRVMADADVDPELLVKVCKALVRLC
jgi:hypothetical protein